MAEMAGGYIYIYIHIYIHIYIYICVGLCLFFPANIGLDVSCFSLSFFGDHDEGENVFPALPSKMSRLADSLSGTCNWRPYPSHVANSRIPSAVAPVVRLPPIVSSTVAAAARPSLPCLFSFTVSAFSRVRGGPDKRLGHRPGCPVNGVASNAGCHGQRGFLIWPNHVLSQPGHAGTRFCRSILCEL